jgi:hypothetical protein
MKSAGWEIFLFRHKEFTSFVDANGYQKREVTKAALFDRLDREY